MDGLRKGELNSNCRNTRLVSRLGENHCRVALVNNGRWKTCMINFIRKQAWGMKILDAE